MIQTHALTKRFRRVLAVDHVDVSVPAGAIYGLIGTNGAGKTTLIKVLMNILTPSSGQAELLSTDSRHLRGSRLASIGYVSENQQLPEWMTIDYLLTYLKPFYPSWDSSLAEDLLSEFALPRDRRFGQLSRGMQVKAALVSSLAYRPKLLILDEPFSGLDPLVRDEFVKGLLERSDGMTIFISSHDLAELETFVTHVAYMDSGRIQFSNETAELFQRFREVEVTLDSPPANTTAAPPSHWLNFESSPHLVRFTTSNFDENRLKDEVNAYFPATGIGNITANSMSLRTIFLALARANRIPLPRS